MRIRLDQRIFREDPYQLFAQIHGVEPSIWEDIYHKRYLWYEYEIPILTEYFNIKTKKNISERTIRRWIKRTDAYNKAQKALSIGVEEVTDEYFEGLTVKELQELCQ